VLSRCPRQVATTKNSIRYKYVPGEQGAQDEKSGEVAFSVCRDSTTAILRDVARRLAFACEQESRHASLARVTLAFLRFFVFKKRTKETRHTLTGGTKGDTKGGAQARSLPRRAPNDRRARHDSSIPRSRARARDRISRYYIPFLDYERIHPPLSPFRFPGLQFSRMHLGRCERERDWCRKNRRERRLAREIGSEGQQRGHGEISGDAKRKK